MVIDLVNSNVAFYKYIGSVINIVLNIYIVDNYYKYVGLLINMLGQL